MVSSNEWLFLSVVSLPSSPVAWHKNSQSLVFLTEMNLDNALSVSISINNMHIHPVCNKFFCSVASYNTISLTSVTMSPYCHRSFFLCIPQKIEQKSIHMPLLFSVEERMVENIPWVAAHNPCLLLCISSILWQKNKSATVFSITFLPYFSFSIILF